MCSTMRAGWFNANGTTGDDDIFVGGGPVLIPDVLFQQGPVIIDGGDRDDHGSSSVAER